MTSTISPASASTSATISVISTRTSRWRVRMVVRGALHAAERSSASPVRSGRASSALDVCVRSSCSRQRSTRCIVLGLLQLQLGDTLPVLILVFQHPLSLLSRLDRHRRHGAQHLRCDGLVDALAGDTQATLLAQLRVRLFASVDRSRIATGVDNAKPTAAARTADETGQ